MQRIQQINLQLNETGGKVLPKVYTQMQNYPWVLQMPKIFQFDHNENGAKGLTVVISGASRGIGLAIGKRLARDGANVCILAKTVTPHPKLPGTIETACKEIEEAGGKSLGIQCDIRNENEVKTAIEKVVNQFGGVDILINNASAISLTDTETTDMKRFDLMHSINTRGTFMMSKYCLPYLKKSKHAHILNISPPLNIEARWFAPHVAYTMAKFGMSFCVLGMATEFKDYGIGVNALWPRTSVATAAVKNMLGGDEMMKTSRIDTIMGDAAYVILTSNPKTTTGNFFIDDEVLVSSGVTDFDQYKVDTNIKDAALTPDYFL